MNHLYSVLQFSSVIILLFTSSSASFSQKDLNNYQTLLSKGEMPADFSMPVALKVQNNYENDKSNFKSKLEGQKYLTKIHTFLDGLMYSGSVTYGDEVSVYVSQLATELVKDKPELMKELRFYTIKSDEVNAFSTAPGIIFVTTGLIAQLSSEAQLAFILSHEIAHYEQKHTHEQYLKTKNAGTIKRASQLLEISQFSKENELKADRIALKRYHSMGYSMKELIGTFDVLMYSYLPFDEIPFPLNYFNTENLYIPEKSINLKIRPITAEENYNDTYRSHPNIRKRKEAIQTETLNYQDWGTSAFVLSKELFLELRTVCRLENIRVNVIDGNQFSALYSIFLMEKEFPNSVYLDKMKALSWLSIIQTKYKIEKKKRYDQIEGESSVLYKFLNKCTSLEIATIGLRTLYDLRVKHAGNSFFEDSYTHYIKAMSEEKMVVLSKFQSFNFHQAATDALNKPQSESGEKKESSNSAEGSKYSRIKEKRSAQSIPVFDSAEFAIYAIPDIIRDTSFINKFKAFREHHDSVEELSKQFDLLSKQEQNKVWKKNVAILSEKQPSFKDILVIEPNIYFDSKIPKVSWELESARKIYLKTLMKSAQKQGFNLIVITHDSIKQKSTEAFNEYCTYLSYLGQINNSSNGNDKLSVDYELLNQFTQSHDTPRILFTQVNYDHFPQEGKDLSMYAVMVHSKSGTVCSYVEKSFQKSGIPENYGPYYNTFFSLIKQF